MRIELYKTFLGYLVIQIQVDDCIMRCVQYVLQLAVFVVEVCLCMGQSGEWSPWGQWSQCSVTCGYGVMKRQKTWLSPRTPSDEVPFKYEDIQQCSTDIPCPIDGHWNFWGPWSECSEMCDGGVTKRERECNAPEPKNGGKDCDGKAIVSATCNDWECPPLPPNFDITKCNETTFMCLSRYQCIPEANVCDDTLQCHDGSDEHECTSYYYGNGVASHRTYLPSAVCLYLTLLVLS